MKKLICILVGIWIAETASAAALTDRATLHRCYSHLTQTRMPLHSRFEQAVDAGEDPIAVCIELLHEATFSGGRISSGASEAAKLTFRNMHKVHYSWFKFRDVQSEIDSNQRNAMGDHYDLSTSALYFTKALFDPNFAMNEAVTEPLNLTPIRTNMNPENGNRTRFAKSKYYWGNNTPFAPAGDLLGIETSTPITLSHPGGPLQIGNSLGGGFIGTPIYVLGSGTRDNNQTPETKKWKANGGLVVKRDFGEAFFHDALCRDELPALRNEDVVPLVDANAGVPFRTTAGCTSCHASIDQVSGVIRNLKFFHPNYTTKIKTGVGMNFWPTNKTGGEEWPADGDKDYAHRPTKGQLMYRNHAGVLRNIAIGSVQDLGNKLAVEEDFYICVAKRYYKYFLGIDAYIADPAATTDDAKLNSPHRRRVIDLGIQLKSHQNPIKTIESILQFPEYRESDFGLKGGSND